MLLGMRLVGCVCGWECFHADLVLRLWHPGGNPSPILDKASVWLHRLKQPLQWSWERPGAVQPCLDRCSFWPSGVSVDFPQLLSSVISLPVCHAVSEKNLRRGGTSFFLEKGWGLFWQQVPSNVGGDIRKYRLIKTITLHGRLLFWGHVWLLATLLGGLLRFSGLWFFIPLLLEV